MSPAGGAAGGTGPRSAYTAGPVGPLPRQDPRAGTPAAPPPGLHTTGLVPVHPATEKLKASRIREWVWQTMALTKDAIEPLPAELRARRDLASAADALNAVHFPETRTDCEGARRRLAFEELFLYQVALATRRQTRRSVRPATRLTGDGELVERWLRSLPFQLTGDQRRACEQIGADLDAGEPMQRLLMGEVGSGKTVVALYAMLRALDAGHQAALMAPTETLAEQHAATLGRLLGAELVPFELLTGATPAPRRRATLDRLASGELGLVVGTHALIEDAGSVLEPRRLRGRRAASLRRPPARGTRCQGPGSHRAARPAHDRDADPAHPLADRLRRPRHDRPARAPGRPAAGSDLARRGGPPPAGLRVHPRLPAAPAARRSSSARW